MPGQVFKLALRVITLVTAGAIGLSPGMTERIPPGRIPSGPIRGAPDPAGRQPPAPPAPVTAARNPAATAARPGASVRNSPMQLRVMRDARPGCGDACAEWIAAEGEIVPGTGEAFAALVRTLGARRLPVFIDSGGGAVQDAITMGKLIRERRLDVAVVETISDCAGCAPGTAQPRSPGAVCASACVIVLAAGIGRVGNLATHVGVHQMSLRGVRRVKQRLFRVYYRTVHGVKREVGRQLLSERTVSTAAVTGPVSQEADDQVAIYFEIMGIGVGLMPLMMSTPSTSIRWLTPREEQDTKLFTATTGGETLLLRQQFARAALPKQGSGETSMGSAGPSLSGVAKAEAIGAGSTGPTAGKVAWTLERPPLEPPTLVALVKVPAAGVALTLRIAPETAAPDAKLVVDAAFAGDGSVASIGPLHSGSLDLSEPAHANGATAWRLALKGDATTLLATPPDTLGLRLQRGNGQAVELTFDAPERLAAMVVSAEKAWTSGADTKDASAIVPETH